MRLCTFEVATHVGRHSRVGVFTNENRIVDVNFATAWYLAQQGEGEPQTLADALCPSDMLAFLRAGLRAFHTAEELFLGAGPRPPDWWKNECPPRGPNDETLVYAPEQVRLLAPIPNPARIGTDQELHSAGRIEPQLKLAAVVGKPGTNIKSIEARGYVAGYTAMIDIGARQSVLGPCLVTPDEVVNLYSLAAVVRINGTEHARATTAPLRLKFEETIETLSAGDLLLPGDVLSFPLDARPPLHPGDVLELQIEKIGALRTRIV